MRVVWRAAVPLPEADRSEIQRVVKQDTLETRAVDWLGETRIDVAQLKNGRQHINEMNLLIPWTRVKCSTPTHKEWYSNTAFVNLILRPAQIVIEAITC